MQSSSNNAPVPLPAGYGAHHADLNGNLCFFMSARMLEPPPKFRGCIARMGTFTQPGVHIKDALEDVTDAGAYLKLVSSPRKLLDPAN